MHLHGQIIWALEFGSPAVPNVIRDSDNSGEIMFCGCQSINFKNIHLICRQIRLMIDKGKQNRSKSAMNAWLFLESAFK